MTPMGALASSSSGPRKGMAKSTATASGATSSGRRRRKTSSAQLSTSSAAAAASLPGGQGELEHAERGERSGEGHVAPSRGRAGCHGDTLDPRVGLRRQPGG